MLWGIIFLESVIIVIYFWVVCPIQAQQTPAQNIARRNTILDPARNVGISAVITTMQKFNLCPLHQNNDLMLTLLQPLFSKVDFLVDIKWIFDVTLGKLHVEKGMSSETFACLMHFTGKRKGLGRMGCGGWISAALLVLLLESNQSYLSLVETWINIMAVMACDGW